MRKPTTPLRLLWLTMAFCVGVSLAAGVATGSNPDRRPYPCNPKRSSCPTTSTAPKPKPTTTTPRPSRPGTGTLTGSIVQTDRTFSCRQPVNLDLLQVTITDAATQKDAVLIRPGCTGTIKRLVIYNTQCDGVKGSANNFTIQSGTMDLPARRSDRLCHQDAFQITGGSNITVSGMTIRGGGHSGFFINGAAIPSNIMLTNSTVGPYPGRSDPFDTDVTIGDSVSSGVSNSTLYPHKQTRLAPNGVYIPSSPSTGGTQARNPINNNNHYMGSGAPPTPNPSPGPPPTSPATTTTTPATTPTPAPKPAPAPKPTPSVPVTRGVPSRSVIRSWLPIFTRASNNGVAHF